MRTSYIASVIALAQSLPTQACDDCYGPQNDVVLTRNVRRMQPDAQEATVQPRAPLEWGQLNFLHTTDTHGWLEGHIKEQNYGADWGDFVTFSRHMKHMAGNYGVDLLLVDTGDLHDGAGLSDATRPNGNVSNAIFENIDYDLLTIGNHELYVTEIAYETFSNFSKFYGDKYITSNVQIINPTTGQFEYIGSQYRYFTTNHGLRIMAFGVLFDFTGNSNVSKVIKTADLVKQQWFLNAINFDRPIDLFVVIGHNPPRPTASTSTFGTLFKTIRNLRPNIPIQTFGGHTHVRDFVVYDNKATGLESGRYCETLGFLSMSGINSSTYRGNRNPRGVPNPTRKAVAVPSGTASASLSSGTTSVMASNSSSNGTTNSTTSATSTLVYSRRYLDWNRLTFAYHASGSQDFDYRSGLRVSEEITNERKTLNLTALYGCAPATYCQYCQPFGAPGNIFTLTEIALATVVVNSSRANNPRLIIINTGSIRFDLVKGPFTYDDSFIVSPFDDSFQFLPDVPYSLASQVIGIRNAGAFEKRELTADDFDFPQLTLDRDICRDPPISHDHLEPRSFAGGRVVRRQNTAPTPGYTTKDDFGTDGDDTPHSAIPNFRQPNNVQANASFPADGSKPEKVDLVFLDFIAKDIVSALNSVGGKYTTANVQQYLPKSFTTNSYLPAYAKVAWQAGVPNCPVGQGVGFSS
ncbi:MAG: hypothetical protein M1835_007887 [Candelina submexicana]|nr:MAG: hypothetical protein M1835_007887 [Candelina submexicana]